MLSEGMSPRVGTFVAGIFSLEKLGKGGLLCMADAVVVSGVPLVGTVVDNNHLLAQGKFIFDHLLEAGGLSCEHRSKYDCE